MEPIHTLDLSRLRHLEAQTKNASAVASAALERLKELQNKHSRVEGQLSNAMKIAKGESSFYPDESVSWQDTRSIRATWAEKVAALQNELDELDAQLEAARAEYLKAAEQGNAALTLLDRCKKFLADQRRDEVEVHFASIEEAARARSPRRHTDV